MGSAAKTKPRIKLSKEQRKVVKAVTTAVKSGQRITVYEGPGGVGKTVVAAEVCRELGRAGYNVVPCTMFGKAAARLQDKLWAADVKLAVKTLSSLCERVYMTDDGPVFSAKAANLPTNSVLFVDELSTMGRRYLVKRVLPSIGAGVPLVGCGDHFQLPPVMDSSTGLLESTDLRLRRVHRQAKDSPILRIGSYMREDRVNFYSFGVAGVNADGHPRRLVGSFAANPGLCVVPAIDWLETLIATYPIDRIPEAPVLAYTNDEVAQINAAVRARYGLRGAYPRNDEIIRGEQNRPGLGVYNGEHYRVEKVLERSKLGVEVLLAGCDDPVYLAGPAGPPPGVKNAIRWGWGYATTIHRAQGSEWEHVKMVVGASAAAASTGLGGRRLLYTGITRASRQLDLIVVDYDYARKVAKINARVKARIRARLQRGADPLEPGRAGRKPSKTRAKPRKTVNKPKPGSADSADLIDFGDLQC